MKELKTGLIEFEVPYETGFVGKLYFNPNDINFYDKLLHLEDSLKAIFQEYEAREVTPENHEEVINDIKGKLCPKIKDEFDYVFGEGASEVIFKYASPVAFVDDVYYPYYFLNEFLPDITKKINKTNEKIRLNYERLSKHAVKYVGKKNVGTSEDNKDK